MEAMRAAVAARSWEFTPRQLRAAVHALAVMSAGGAGSGGGGLQGLQAHAFEGGAGAAERDGKRVGEWASVEEEGVAGAGGVAQQQQLLQQLEQAYAIASLSLMSPSWVMARRVQALRRVAAPGAARGRDATRDAAVT